MKLKKILYLLVLTVLLFGINSNCFAVTNKGMVAEVSYEGVINIAGSIFKTNDHHDGLLGAKFRVYDINNTFSYYSEDEGNGLYGLGYSGSNIKSAYDTSVTYEKVFNMLPRSNQEDVSEFIRTGSTEHFSDFYNVINSSKVSFGIPLFIEEVKAPEGYVIGDKIIMSAMATIELKPSAIRLTIEGQGYRYYLKYNNNVDYNNLQSYVDKNLFLNDVVDCSRLNFQSNVLDNANISYVPLILFNEKGNVSLKINNYVNNLSKYTTTRGKTLNYRIEVVNSGSAPSTNNVIVTNVPKELVYVKGSASDGGIYNKTNHTITWRVNSIKANSTVSFRYSATVPKDAMTGIEFIGKSTISSQEIGEIQSRKTNVSLINNPKTAAPIAVLVIIVSMLGIMTVIKNHKKEQEMN